MNSRYTTYVQVLYGKAEMTNVILKWAQPTNRWTTQIYVCECVTLDDLTLQTHTLLSLTYANKETAVIHDPSSSFETNKQQSFVDINSHTYI